MVDDKDEKDKDDLDEDEEEESLDEDEMPDIGGDTMIGNLDDDDDDDDDDDGLVRSAPKPDPDEAARKREVRRRLEEFAERRNKDLDDTFNFDFDEDI